MAAQANMGDISLVWHTVLMSGLEKLRNDTMLCDTTIATSDGQSLATHACVLAAASPVLQTSLVKIAERCYLVNIPGITCQVWKYVLQFIYTGNVDADCLSNVEEVATATVTLQLPLLQQFIDTIQMKHEVDTCESKQPDIDHKGKDNSDFGVTIKASGDRTVVLKLVKNKGGCEGQAFHLETVDEEGDTEEGHKDAVNDAGTNEDVLDDKLVDDQSSEMAVGIDADTNCVATVCSDAMTLPDVEHVTEVVSLSGTIETKSTKGIESDGGAESTQTPKDGVASPILRHECGICGHRFHYRSALSIHLRTHTDEKPYTCMECGVKFGNRTVLKNHMRTHKTNREIFQCDECDKCFLTKSGLWQHRRSHRLRSGPAATTCTTCEKQFDSMDKLREHLVFEHDRKIFACVKCHKIFQSEEALSAHTETHAGEKEFTCSECGQSFDQHTALKCHQRLHAGEKRFSCEECGARFQTKCGFKAHSKRHSVGREQFSCPCGKVYTTLRGLHHHRETHHPNGKMDKKHECSICHSQFETAPELNEHKASEHRRRYLCGECGNTFSTPGALLRHTLIHTGEKPFACMTCGRAFRTRGTLVAHERCHSGEKPFPCFTCGARFRVRNALTIHKRIHTGERPYECDVCGARFRSRTLQMAHQQRHHTPTSDRKHVCSKCGKVFLSRSTLREHELRNHADDPSVEEARRCVCTLCGKVVAHAASLRSHMYVHVKKKLFQCIQCESAFRRNSDLKRHLRQVHGYEVVPDAATVMESHIDNSHVICEPVLEQEILDDSTTVFTANL